MTSPRKTRRRADFDGAWKEALRRHLSQFLEILFPDLADAIDGSKPVVFLDKELRAATRKAKSRKRHADVFARVTLKSGVAQLLFLHAEVQNEPDIAFPRRMFGYNHRLGDLAGQDVLSLAILADGQDGWCPDRYERELFGSRLVFIFPVVKLLDLRDRREDLRKRGVAGLVILAQLDAIECRRQPGELRERKFGLIKELYTAGLNKEEIQGIYELIDWMITLPDLEENRLLRQIEEYEAKITMPRITSAERIGLQRGREEGLREAVVLGFEARWGTLAAESLELIGRLDEDLLRRLVREAGQIVDATALAAWLAAARSGA